MSIQGTSLRKIESHMDYIPQNKGLSGCSSLAPCSGLGGLWKGYPQDISFMPSLSFLFRSCDLWSKTLKPENLREDSKVLSGIKVGHSESAIGETCGSTMSTYNVRSWMLGSTWEGPIFLTFFCALNSWVVSIRKKNRLSRARSLMQC